MLLHPPNAEKRIVNGLAAADRAFAGRRHPVAFGKNETAGPALSRGYRKHRAGGVEAAADMFEMGVDFFFREVGEGGNILCRDWAFAEKSRNGMTGCLLGRAGNHRFLRFVLHGASPDSQFFP